jgi:hypothetical protein
MRPSRAALSDEQILAAARLVQGEDPETLAHEHGVPVSELRRWGAQLEQALRKVAQRQARKQALEATREAAIEERVRRYLTEQGYSVTARQRRTGPDIVATKEGETLLVEVKGDRPGHVDHSATITITSMS